VVHTRFPFRFGKASMTEMPVAYVRAEWEAKDGTVFEGVSASGIPPLWFDKREGKTAGDNERDLLISVRAAAEAYKLAGFGSAWDLHKAVTEPVRDSLVAQAKDPLAPLAAGFGPAMLEAALVDGICRHGSVSFGAALRGGTLGVPAEVRAALPPSSLDFVSLRHTVGLADALTAADVANPLRDGLPETLEQVVAVYKPVFFKVKMNGDAAETLPRLLRIAAVLQASGSYSVTLDGNEQFENMAAFADFLDRLRAEPGLRDFLARVLWIEQPVRRDASLDPASATALARVSAFRPVIQDESDGEADALERGLALGYGGVSSKTCKGLFRSLSHKARLAAGVHASRLSHEKSKGLPGLILSCEDLTTVPVHPLQQDLCLAAALGLNHAERNGHHYILPSGFLSARECRDALAECPSLYETNPGGDLRVRITDGGFRLAEVNAARGLGSAAWPDWESLQSLDVETGSTTGTTSGSRAGSKT
jgi:hypothetical protein